MSIIHFSHKQMTSDQLVMALNWEISGKERETHGCLQWEEVNQLGDLGDRPFDISEGDEKYEEFHKAVVAKLTEIDESGKYALIVSDHPLVRKEALRILGCAARFGENRLEDEYPNYDWNPPPLYPTLSVQGEES